MRIAPALMQWMYPSCACTLAFTLPSHCPVGGRRILRCCGLYHNRITIDFQEITILHRILIDALSASDSQAVTFARNRSTPAGSAWPGRGSKPEIRPICDPLWQWNQVKRLGQAVEIACDNIWTALLVACAVYLTVNTDSSSAVTVGCVYENRLRTHIIVQCQSGCLLSSPGMCPEILFLERGSRSTAPTSDMEPEIVNCGFESSRSNRFY